MDHLLWIALFLSTSLFSCWVLFWGGAEWLEGSFLSGFFVHSRAPLWSAEGIKIFVGIAWLAHAGWFILGFIYPDIRRIYRF